MTSRLLLSPKLSLDTLRAIFPGADVRRVPYYTNYSQEERIAVSFADDAAATAARALLARRPDRKDETGKGSDHDSQ